jgi:hypothetical protein
VPASTTPSTASDTATTTPSSSSTK